MPTFSCHSEYMWSVANCFLGLMLCKSFLNSAHTAYIHSGSTVHGNPSHWFGSKAQYLQLKIKSLLVPWPMWTWPYKACLCMLWAVLLTRSGSRQRVPRVVTHHIPTCSVLIIFCVCSPPVKSLSKPSTCSGILGGLPEAAGTSPSPLPLPPPLPRWLAGVSKPSFLLFQGATEWHLRVRLGFWFLPHRPAKFQGCQCVILRTVSGLWAHFLV